MENKSDFKPNDTVYEKANGKQWTIESRASALEEEPPIKWKCMRWVIGSMENKYEDKIFDEGEITKFAPPRMPFA